LLPVGPWFGWKSEAPSDVAALLNVMVVTSNCSSIPPGGAIDVCTLFPNIPRMSEPSTVVVRDGAAIRRVFAL